MGRPAWRCGDCGHFRVEQHGKGPVREHCGKIEQEGHDREAGRGSPPTPGPLAWTSDSACHNPLYVAEDFGCVLFEPRKGEA